MYKFHTNYRVCTNSIPVVLSSSLRLVKAHCFMHAFERATWRVQHGLGLVPWAGRCMGLWGHGMATRSPVEVVNLCVDQALFSPTTLAFYQHCHLEIRESSPWRRVVGWGRLDPGGPSLPLPRRAILSHSEGKESKEHLSQGLWSSAPKGWMTLRESTFWESPRHQAVAGCLSRLPNALLR